MIFCDRIEAGEKLSQKLLKYQNNTDAIVIGLSRGGVPVAFVVARNLCLPLDVISPRKIGAPFNREYAIGAITESGEPVFDWEAIRSLCVSEDYLKEAVEKEKVEAEKRMTGYRKGFEKRNLKDKTILLIDDGLATGYTMRAAIECVRKEKAKKIVVAVPVSPKETLKEIEKLVDEVICLSTPSSFQAVGQFYEDFAQTSHEEVITLLKSARKETKSD